MIKQPAGTAWSSGRVEKLAGNTAGEAMAGKASSFPAKAIPESGSGVVGRAGTSGRSIPYRRGGDGK